MQETRAGYIVSTRCKGCMVKDRHGNPLRDVLDEKKQAGTSTPKLIAWLVSEGAFLTQPNLDKHFREHSAWISLKHKQLTEAKTKNALARIQVEHRNAEDEIQRLVDLGAARIDDGELLVDKEMYLFALDRKTKNSTPISVQNLVMNFGDSLVEAQRRREVTVIDESS